MLAFGRLTELPQILEQIGGITLAAHEARQEQDGTVVRELPTATDERFVVEKDEPVSEETTEQPTDEEQAGETEAEPDDTGTEETAESETETTNETDM